MALTPDEILQRFIPPVSGQTLREFQQLKFAASVGGARFPSEFFASQLPSEVSQGEVLGPLPLLWYDTDGQRYEEEVLAMLISLSCDFDHDPTALFAPCFPASRFAGKGYYASITAQEKASLFYLAPTADREALVADLSNIQPFPISYVVEGLASKRISRVCSFSPMGYVLMLLKLTHHLMRVDSPDEIRNSARPRLIGRIATAFKEIGRLVQYVIIGTRE